MERKKWNTKKMNFQVGDVVLIADEKFPRGTWPLTWVVGTIAGRDGLVRSVKVKTASTVVTRSKRKRKEEFKTSTVIRTRPVTRWKMEDGRRRCGERIMINKHVTEG